MHKHPEKIAEFLLAGDEQGTITYITDYLEANKQLSLYEDFLTPAMYIIGKLWEKNEISVADEHLATATCDFVISMMENHNNDASNPLHTKVMLFAVEEEEHYIGLKMAANVFKENGWEVRYLGPNLPLEHAIAAVNTWQPNVIGLSAALSYRLPKLTETVQRLSLVDNKPFIVLGGRMADKFPIPNELATQVFSMNNLHALQNWLNVMEKGGRFIDARSG
ncbi:cobalamin-dependent protein [Virgibacillus halodenitrificans]|uniref:cobalamin B12-binding domain-containing protein n=1 Tax=Virgibacillus halodenitrificans TaxID=1482 RepID=UPI00136CEEDE|nr:cobalamin-dependent protein [Virgibacillus halodenitrificans]MCJ0932461.1 cobalamin-dependent protein [Virgibacillus halodenitrificans]MYL58301.1 cobalamin-binding domain protein [Virgibacillus halodenitrificans]